VLTEPLLSNGSLFLFHYPGLQPSCHNIKNTEFIKRGVGFLVICKSLIDINLRNCVGIKRMPLSDLQGA
jgi:hypothetical protein